MKKFLKLFFIFLLTQSLISCLGGDGGTTSANGGTSGTGISAGGITGFGSIFVNGVEFETTNSSITIDGQSGLSQSDLEIGMVVSVEGTITGATGTAINIVAEDILEGVVESIPDNNTLIVMGQTVGVDTTTLFNNNVPDFASISPGDTLEISGHVKGDGIIAATYIEKKLTAVNYEVKGFVSNHNNGTNTFNIGTLIVGYSAAIINNMPNPATSWNGLLVEAKGNIYAAGTLTATRVEPEGLPVSNAEDAEVEGFVTSIVDANNFVLGNQAIQINASTIFEGGLAADIVAGLKLEAEGTLVAGLLTATKISFRDNIKIEADVETVDIGNRQLTLSGLPGITVNADDLTEFKSGITSINDISISDHLRIRGRATSGTEIMATEIEARSADTRVILQAPVDSFASPNVVLLGVSVDTSTISNTNFKDVSDTVITSTEFFNNLSNGTLVKAGGNLAGVITWDQIELEE